MEKITWKETVTIKEKRTESTDSKATVFIKTVMHAFVLPLVFGILLIGHTETATQALVYGAFYMIIPWGMYETKQRPEPTGFFILAACYLWLVVMIWAAEGGPYHVL